MKCHRCNIITIQLILITPNSTYFSIIVLFPSFKCKGYAFLLLIIIKESDFCGIRFFQLIKKDSNSSESSSDRVQSEYSNIYS